MKRVLFVDDEPRVLEGLQRMLRSWRQEWEMVFVTDGQAALEALEAEPFDVVVTDMRMPVMDGATLLTEVQRRFPDTVRIVLSGHTDRSSAARAAKVAHQFLAKPADPEVLTETVSRAFRLRTTLNQPAIREILGSIESLPTIPALYAQLLDLLAKEDPPLGEITAIVSQDISMSAKVLQLANSSMFGVSRDITTLEGAVRLLGVNFISKVVLSTEVFHAFDAIACPPGLSIDLLQQHSFLVATIAPKLMPDRSRAEDVYVAGMLHNLGLLALLDRIPEEYCLIWQSALERGISLRRAETEAIGVTHTQVSAYLISLWHLPVSIAEAVAFHHEPATAGPEAGLGPLILHVANALAHLVAPEFSLTAQPIAIDFEHLEAQGILEKLPEWETIAHACHEAMIATAPNTSK